MSMTTEALGAQVTELTHAVQDAQAQLIEGVAHLKDHNLDKDAHGLSNPDSPFRQAVKEAASEAAQEVIAGDGFKAVATKMVGEAIDQQLPTVLKSELHNPQSLINQSIGSCVESVIDDKIKNGEITGSGPGGNKPSNPTDPENPDNPDTPPTIDPEKPDDTDFWDKIDDPTDTGTLEAGDLYAAPTITAKPYWLKGSLAGLTFTPAEGMAVVPAKYELYIQGQEAIAEVTVNSEGTGIYNAQLPDADGPAKLLLAAVAIDQYGNRSQMAKLILRIVNEDYVLLPEFLVPETDGEAFNNEQAIWRLAPFKTLCGNESELHTNSRFRIVNEAGQTLFDSYAVSDTSQLELYAAATPGVAMTPDTEYYFEAQFKGITLGWSGWARRTVKVSRVATPVITSPVENSKINWPKGIGVTLSDFALASGGLDIHSSTDWVISRDPERLDVVKMEAGSSDLTSHNILPDDLTNGDTYYLSARVNAQASGASAWATPVPIIAYDGYVKQTSITTPVGNDNISFNETGISVTTAPFATDGYADQHIATDYKICSDVNGASVVLQALESPDLLTHLFTVAECANLTHDSTLYVFARHKGRRLGWGDWSNGVAVKMKKVTVNRPSITSPASAAKIAANTLGLVATSSAFGIVNTSDTHKSSDWKITSDAAGNTIVAQVQDSSDKTSHTFTGLNLTVGSTYYLFTRHKSSKGFISDWSAGVAFSVLRGLISASGRPVYCDPSGVVINVDMDYWGIKKTLKIPVAQYRGVLQMGTYGLDLPELANFQKTGMYLAGSSVDAKAALPAITDKSLQTILADYKTDKTGRENSNIWMTKTSHTDTQKINGVPAVQHCRNLNIGGFGAGYFDLPNAYELAVIYAESDNIDALDQTAAANPGKMLGKGGTNGRFYFAGANYAYAFSSTEYHSSFVIGVYYNGYVDTPYKASTCAVIPARAI